MGRGLRASPASGVPQPAMAPHSLKAIRGDVLSSPPEAQKRPVGPVKLTPCPQSLAHARHQAPGLPGTLQAHSHLQAFACAVPATWMPLPSSLNGRLLSNQESLLQEAFPGHPSQAAASRPVGDRSPAMSGATLCVLVAMGAPCGQSHLSGLPLRTHSLERTSTC